MPPDDTDGLGDDLPGLHDDQVGDDSPSTEADGWDDPDLPGLEGDSPSPEVEVPTEQAETTSDPTKATDESDWTEAELDDWFVRDFGGDQEMLDRFGEYPVSRAELASKYDIGMLSDSLISGQQAYTYVARWLRDRGRNREDTWSEMSADERAQFRRGWEDYETALAAADSIAADSVVGELAPYGPDYSNPAKRSVPRWIFVGGGFGILGLVLMVGFFLSSGSDETDASTAPSSTEAAVTETAPPTTVPPVTATAAPPVPAFATVTGTLEPVLPPDPLFVYSVTSNFLTMEFPTAGGPFSGTAVLELLHDVPRDGCQFRSVHEWEFAGMFDPATLEFSGTFTEVTDATTGNCAPGQAHLIYEMEPSEGTFYAGLYSQDGEIRGSAFTRFTAPVSQTLIDGLSGS